MKQTKSILKLILITLTLCISAYIVMSPPIRTVVTSIYEVPQCTARVARKLKIQPDFFAVKDHIIRSLKLGMTLDEVEATLNQITLTRTETSFIDGQGETNTQVLVRLCDNPLGNVLLFVSYSKDGHLINVVDPYDN